MDILHRGTASTVVEIRERMEKAPTPNAVRTMLQILEEKGLVKRSKRGGRVFRYSPADSRKRAGLTALGHVLQTFYEGSIADALAAHLSKGKRDLSPEDAARLQELIDQATNTPKK